MKLKLSGNALRDGDKIMIDEHTYNCEYMVGELVLCIDKEFYGCEDVLFINPKTVYEVERV